MDDDPLDELPADSRSEVVEVVRAPFSVYMLRRLSRSSGRQNHFRTPQSKPVVQSVDRWGGGEVPLHVSSVWCR